MERRPTGLKEAREIVSDLFEPRSGIYWPDFLVSAGTGWTAFALAVLEPIGSPAGTLAVILAVLALYRALLFIHELTHLRRGALPGFALAWNVFAGIPLLVPSFTYVGVHTDHHRRTIYGTPADPEYLPLAREPRWASVRFLAGTLFAPLLFLLRFTVGSAIGLLVPPLHRWLERRASSLVINTAYVRREGTAAERRRLRVAELAILTVWGVGIALVVGGVLPVRILAVWYLVSAGVALINQVRTLAAHRFTNDGKELDVVGQLLDTVNVPGGPWTSRTGVAAWPPMNARLPSGSRNQSAASTTTNTEADSLRIAATEAEVNL